MGAASAPKPGAALGQAVSMSSGQTAGPCADGPQPAAAERAATPQRMRGSFEPRDRRRARAVLTTTIANSASATGATSPPLAPRAQPQPEPLPVECPASADPSTGILEQTSGDQIC